MGDDIVANVCCFLFSVNLTTTSGQVNGFYYDF